MLAKICKVSKKLYSVVVVFLLVAVTTLLFFLLSSGSAQAEKHLVSIKDRAFINPEIRIRAGDIVVFKNSGPGRVVLYTETDRYLFITDMLEEGEGEKVLFDKPGDYLVECIFHHRMKLQITVEPERSAKMSP